jgi:hypothetical protein
MGVEMEQSERLTERTMRRRVQPLAPQAVTALARRSEI